MDACNTPRQNMFALVVVAGNVTQCRRRCMNEGTVNCGVALRPRPAEVQLRIYGYYIVYYILKQQKLARKIF